MDYIVPSTSFYMISDWDGRKLIECVNKCIISVENPHGEAPGWFSTLWHQKSFSALLFSANSIVPFGKLTPMVKRWLRPIKAKGELGGTCSAEEEEGGGMLTSGSSTPGVWLSWLVVEAGDFPSQTGSKPCLLGFLPQIFKHLGIRG